MMFVLSFSTLMRNNDINKLLNCCQYDTVFVLEVNLISNRLTNKHTAVGVGMYVDCTGRIAMLRFVS